MAFMDAAALSSVWWRAATSLRGILRSGSASLLPPERLCQECPQHGDGVHCSHPGVRAGAKYSREAERDTTGVSGGALNAVEGDLDDLLRSDMDHVAFTASFKVQEALGLPREHLVGHPLESLSDHDPAASVIIV